MGYNRKVKLLVSELFRRREGGSKRSLSLRTQLHKMQRGSKTDLRVEKKPSYLDWIVHLPNAEKPRENLARDCQYHLMHYYAPALVGGGH